MSLVAEIPNVADAASARAFLAFLHERGMLYHPEESAAASLGAHHLPVATLAVIDSGMEDCFAYLADPCEFALEAAGFSRAALAEAVARA